MQYANFIFSLGINEVTHILKPNPESPVHRILLIGNIDRGWALTPHELCEQIANGWIFKTIARNLLYPSALLIAKPPLTVDGLPFVQTEDDDFMGNNLLNLPQSPQLINFHLSQNQPPLPSLLNTGIINAAMQR